MATWSIIPWKARDLVHHHPTRRSTSKVTAWRLGPSSPGHHSVAQRHKRSSARKVTVWRLGPSSPGELGGGDHHPRKTSTSETGFAAQRPEAEPQQYRAGMNGGGGGTGGRLWAVTRAGQRGHRGVPDRCCGGQVGTSPDDAGSQPPQRPRRVLIEALPS